MDLINFFIFMVCYGFIIWYIVFAPMTPFKQGFLDGMSLGLNKVVDWYKNKRNIKL